MSLDEPNFSTTELIDSSGTGAIGSCAESQVLPCADLSSSRHAEVDVANDEPIDDEAGGAIDWNQDGEKVCRQIIDEFTNLLNPLEVKMEEEDFLLDPLEEDESQRSLILNQIVKSSKRRAKKRKPDPPGSPLSDLSSPASLRHRFKIFEGVEFVLPSSYDRAESPPLNHFTMYECFIEDDFYGFRCRA